MWRERLVEAQTDPIKSKYSRKGKLNCLVYVTSQMNALSNFDFYHNLLVYNHHIVSNKWEQTVRGSLKIPDKQGWRDQSRLVVAVFSFLSISQDFCLGYSQRGRSAFTMISLGFYYKSTVIWNIICNVCSSFLRPIRWIWSNDGAGDVHDLTPIRSSGCPSVACSCISIVSWLALGRCHSICWCVMLPSYTVLETFPSLCPPHALIIWGSEFRFWFLRPHILQYIDLEGIITAPL